MGSAPGSGSGGSTSRAPGAEKRAGNNNGYGSGSGGQRGSSGTAVGMSMQANGRTSGPRPNGNQSPAVAGPKVSMKDTTTAVNRVDEIKLNDPALVSQALSELNSSKKTVRVEKEKCNALEGIDLNNYASKWLLWQDVAVKSCELAVLHFSLDPSFYISVALFYACFFYYYVNFLS
jgi:hypothetical protein